MEEVGEQGSSWLCRNGIKRDYFNEFSNVISTGVLRGCRKNGKEHVHCLEAVVKPNKRVLMCLTG